MTASGTSFLIGFGVALLPAVGPFIAVILFISSRITVGKRDSMWAVAALAYSLPLAASGDAAAAVSGIAQVAAGWLIYRAFGVFGAADEGHRYGHGGLGAGLVSGLAVVMGLNLLHVEAWNVGTAKTVAQAIMWGSSPALFGHTVLVLGGLIAVLMRHQASRFAALALSGLGILLSGSREAALGWLLIALVSALSLRHVSVRGRLVELGFIGVMVAAAAGLGPMFGWGTAGFVLQPAAPSMAHNLLQGTEVAAGDWWDTRWVSVEARDVSVGAQELTAYSVRKNGAEGWLRLQQGVKLEPGDRYTVSTWIHETSGAARPGIQGWGQLIEGRSTSMFVISGELSKGDWNARVSGPGQLLDAGVAEDDGRWRRVYVTFAYTGDAPLAWYVGLVPDAREEAGTASEFAGFQLERGDLSAYEPGSPKLGLSLVEARLPTWRAAWEGVLERPWTGWGTSRFSEYFTDLWPERSRIQFVPANAHNLFLNTWFERGVFGLVGILTFLGILLAPAIGRSDVPLLALLVAVILANVFDGTLLYGGVFYPLVAIAGWRAGAAREDSRTASEPAREFAARLGLALADTVSAGLALLGSLAFTSFLGDLLGVPDWDIPFTSALAYSVFLWPLLSWREGLFPGYGLTPQQELKKEATVSLHAALILAAASVLLPSHLSMPVPTLVVLLAGSFVLLPAGRAAMKRILHAGNLWGRPVVVLGAGDTGSRIVRSLGRTPLDGLHPVAFFDDDRSLWGSEMYGVRVAGSLDDAGAFAKRQGIHHAIVAIPSLGPERLRDLLDTKGRTFRTVQYVPSLAGAPAEDVYASNLDGMLAIEVRNNLASARNRIVKRAIDVVGGVIGLLMIAPLLLALGAWVRLDSRGPALYWSKRVGEGGDVFACLKFRTMVVDAEERLQELMVIDPLAREEYERFHKLENDPRVTRAGRFLRKYSLDELPQLVNVVMGQMSLVGPRPYMTSELPLMSSHADVILQAKPGMTGYWQVSERNDVTFRDRLEMEAHYVRNWSIWWDIVILARTPSAVIKKRGR